MQQTVSSSPQKSPRCSVCQETGKKTNLTLVSFSAKSNDPLHTSKTLKEGSQNQARINDDFTVNFFSTIDAEFMEEQTNRHNADTNFQKFRNIYVCSECISRLNLDIMNLKQGKKQHEQKDEKPNNLQNVQLIKNYYASGTLSILIQNKMQVYNQADIDLKDKQFKQIVNPRLQGSILGLVSNNSQEIYHANDDIIKVKSKQSRNEKQKNGIFELGLISNSESDHQKEGVSSEESESEVIEICKISEILNQNLSKQLLHKMLIQDMKLKIKNRQNDPKIQQNQQNCIDKQTQKSQIQSKILKQKKDGKIYSNCYKPFLNHKKKLPTKLNRMFEKQEKKNFIQGNQKIYSEKQKRQICHFCEQLKITIQLNQEFICIECYMDKYLSSIGLHDEKVLQA